MYCISLAPQTSGSKKKSHWQFFPAHIMLSISNFWGIFSLKMLISFMLIKKTCIRKSILKIENYCNSHCRLPLWFIILYYMTWPVKIENYSLRFLYGGRFMTYFFVPRWRRRSTRDLSRESQFCHRTWIRLTIVLSLGEELTTSRNPRGCRHCVLLTATFRFDESICDGIEVRHTSRSSKLEVVMETSFSV